MITKYSYLTDKELIALLRDSELEWVRELCQRLEKKIEEYETLLKGGYDVE